jgi:hypothetical protein
VKVTQRGFTFRAVCFDLLFELLPSRRSLTRAGSRACTLTPRRPPGAALAG